MGTVYPLSSHVNCPVSLSLARKLIFTHTHRDATEKIQTVKIPLNKALDMVSKNKIADAPTFLLILKTYYHLKNKR